MSDFIRREDVINKFVGLNMQVYEGDTCVGIRTYLTKEEIIYAINDIPSAELEKKKGKWIHKEYFIGTCYAECNKCHQHTRGIAEDNGFGFNYKFYNFCPHCGADMRGE